MSNERRVHRIERAEEEAGFTHVFFCPACKEGHGFSDRGPGPVWKFNGDLDNPTIEPSVKVERPDKWSEAEQKFMFTHVCHSTISNGMISFCPDCTHDMKDQTVPLPTF